MGLLIFYFRKRFERLLESELISEVKLQQNQKLVWETTFISCDFVNMTQKSIVFIAAVRGFHVYKMSWKPEEGEILECLYEENNPYDVFSIKVCKSNNAQSVVGHLPMEISRITKFILQRGARLQATVTRKHYRRSFLIQRGLEVPCLVTVKMPGSIMNHLLIARYEKLLGELYLEPKDEEIMETFLSVIRENDFVAINQCTPCEASSSTKNKKKAEVRSREI